MQALEDVRSLAFEITQKLSYVENQTVSNQAQHKFITTSTEISPIESFRIL